ncbi:7620_t:CDS:2 [Paraglomus occultum]|uniref:Endonuclease III homolog n=1 Tax=Paraglomus occultum TaxID=144539 RepID=A0A9N9C104_9GLOM|nr:7620_t:CDS:2 [Paraglomus occultum]
MRLNTATNTAQKYEVPVTRKRARAHVKIEVEEETKAKDRTVIKNIKTILIEDESEKKVLPKKMRKKNDQLNNAVPDNWEYVYNGIKEYRKRVTAPVDTMGCERLADEPSETVTAETSRFQSLVALMLSSQTKDTVTAAAIKNLQQRLPNGLTLQSVLDADEEFIDACISKVGFHKRKAMYIKQAAVICRDLYGGDIPDTVEGLMNLPGVGPKMAYLCMQVAWKKNQGIGVDVHVHRISNRLAWCKTEKGGPEATRKALESWLPQSLWSEINPLFVGFGQVSSICPSTEVKAAIAKGKLTRFD